eukprot:9321187-Karenia_brevis.AAC.1
MCIRDRVKIGREKKRKRHGMKKRTVDCTTHVDPHSQCTAMCAHVIDEANLMTTMMTMMTRTTTMTAIAM